VRLCRSFIERQLSGVYTYITSQDIGFLLIKSTFWIENACLEFIWTLKKIKNTLETPAPCGSKERCDRSTLHNLTICNNKNYVYLSSWETLAFWMLCRISPTSSSGAFSFPHPRTRDKSFPVPNGTMAMGGSGCNSQITISSNWHK
jgi:hypothetical protein